MLLFFMSRSEGSAVRIAWPEHSTSKQETQRDGTSAPGKKMSASLDPVGEDETDGVTRVCLLCVNGVSSCFVASVRRPTGGGGASHKP